MAWTGKSPDNPLLRKTLGDHRIFIDIIVIVEVNEPVMQRLAENGKSDRGQDKANRCHLPALSRREVGDGGFWRGHSFHHALIAIILPEDCGQGKKKLEVFAAVGKKGREGHF